MALLRSANRILYKFPRPRNVPGRHLIPPPTLERMGKEIEGGLTSCNGPDERLWILKRLIFALTRKKEGRREKYIKKRWTDQSIQYMTS
jgi:hypothetical protein